MTRLLTCGWETGDVNEMGAFTGTGFGSQIGIYAAVTSGPAPRSPGTYCLKMTAINQAYGTALTQMFPAAVTEIWMRLGFYILSASGFGLPMVLRILDQAGGVQGMLRWTLSDNQLRLYLGNTTGTVLGTGTMACATGVWHLLEIRWQITSTTSGTSEVWLDGTRDINFTGDNTATANANIQGVQIECTGLSNPGAADAAFDDLAVNDTTGAVNNGRPGDGRIILLRPNGTNTALLTRAGTDTGANHTQVNEVPMSMAQRVQSDNITMADLYTLDNLPVAPSTINTVEIIALAQNSDVGGGHLGLTLKSGATTVESAPLALSVSPQLFKASWPTDPNTNAPWTAAAVDAVLAGPTVR